MQPDSSTISSVSYYLKRKTDSPVFPQKSPLFQEILDGIFAVIFDGLDGTCDYYGGSAVVGVLLIIRKC